jgi:hypothetical protein
MVVGMGRVWGRLRLVIEMLPRAGVGVRVLTIRLQILTPAAGRLNDALSLSAMTCHEGPIPMSKL